MKNRTFPKIAKLGLLASLLLGLCACQTHQPTETTSGQTQIDSFNSVGLNIEGKLNADGTLDPAHFLGKFLPNQKVKIVGAKARLNNGGRPQIQFSIQNQKDKGEAIQYRFTWMDSDGFVIQTDQNPWQTIHLAGRELGTIESTARSSEATAFKLIVRSISFKK